MPFSLRVCAHSSAPAVNWHSFSVCGAQRTLGRSAVLPGVWPHTHAWVSDTHTQKEHNALLQSVMLILSVCSLSQHGSSPPSSPQETHKVSKSSSVDCLVKMSSLPFLSFFSSPHSVCHHDRSELVGYGYSDLLQTPCSKTGLRLHTLHIKCIL